MIDGEYIYAMDVPHEFVAAMQRYTEDYEGFISLYPGGAAS